MNVTDKTGMAKWIEACDDAMPLDLVIANAGVSTSSIGEAAGRDALQTQQMVFDVNLQGTLNTIFPILPRMQQRKKGHIVLMSSMASFRGLPRAPAYAASKAAIKIYGEAMGARWGRQGVHFSVLCPGFIETPLTDKNQYTMPFKITLDNAVRRMVRGIEKRKPFIAFPWPMHVMCYILSVLPTRLAQFIMKHMAG
jgi:short-subunit dehydrogenase